MEAQIPRQHVHNGDEQLPGSGLTSAMQGVDDGHHEKKSVIKNVTNKAKAKAKKIKETLTKHGHGHEHDHDRDHHSHEEYDDDDDDDDEELVEDPEVHGAPMYESAAVRSGVGAGHPVGVNLEKPTIMEKDRYKNTITDPPTRPFSQDEPEQGQFRNIERGVDENKGNPRVKIGTSTQMEDDPHAPKDRQKLANYQTKVADPTDAGGAEAGITPILGSFDKMSVHDKPHKEPNPDNTPKLFTGSHDQFSPEPIPENAPKNPESALKALTGEKQSGYTEKISFATSALTNKAVAAKNIVASKLGYGEKEGSGISTAGEKEGSGISTAGGGVTATVADYAHRAAATVTETLAPVTGKVTDVGSSFLSKVQGGPTGHNKMPTKETEEETIENKETSKGVTGYLAEKLRPSEEDKALSEVISSKLYRKKAEGEDKPMGKVTVSDEVASRLGTTEEVPKREKEKEKEGVDARVVGNVRPDMVERVKGWFGISHSQSSQPSQGDTNVGDERSSSTVDSGGERRLQESEN